MENKIKYKNLSGSFDKDQGKNEIYHLETMEDLKDIKHAIIRHIAEIIVGNNWSQSYTAKLLEVDQPKVSQIKHCKIDGFSLERLLKFLVLLGLKISIKVV